MSSGPTTFHTYSFPYVQNVRRNFGDGRLAGVTLPGAGGAYNPDGDLFAPAQPGRVEVSFRLAAASREAMDDLRDAVYAMRYWGLKKLTFQPTDPNDTARFCWARVESIQMAEDKANHSDLIQDVSMIFNVPDPRLFGDSQATWTIGDGSDVGDPGLVIGSGGVVKSPSGLTTQVTVTNAGNAPTIPVITVVPGAGNSCENPYIERVESGLVRDYVQYTGTLSNTDELYLNGKTHRATVNGSAVWDSIGYGHNNFIILMPGDNTINIDFANVGDQATVTFYFYDTWI